MRRRANICIAFGGIATTIGILVLFAWQFGIPTLATWVPEAPIAGPNLAACLIALGVGTCLAPMLRSVGVWRMILVVPSSVALAISGATVAEHVMDRDLGIDQLLLAPEVEGAAPRLSFPTSVALVFLGLAVPLSAFPLRWQRRPAIALATIATFFSLSSLLGYAYRFPALYGGADSPVSLPAAAGVTALGASVLFLTAEDWYLAPFVRDTPAGRNARRLLLTAVIVPFGAVWVKLAADRIGILPVGVGDALVVLVTGIAIVFVIWWNTRELDRVHHEVLNLKLDLERRVAERTQELEQSNRELEAFSYSVSHDLRNPLHIVHGYTEIVLHNNSKSLDAETRGHLQEIRRAAGRMKELTESLLRLSRLSKVQLKTEAVELARLAQETFDRLQARDRERRAHFVLEGESWALGDRSLLLIVIENLMSNAWKFTRGKDNTRITFGGNRVGGSTTFYVRDNGIGFEQREADELFRPFRRLHSAQDFEGTGIGLATVARIVRRHGGSAFATGAPGQGATFSFTLPSLPLPPGEPGKPTRVPKPRSAVRFVPVKSKNPSPS